MNKLKLYMLSLALPLFINCGGGEDSSADVIEPHKSPLRIQVTPHY
jgi:hypothetical protein